MLAVGAFVRLREPFSLRDAFLMTWSGLRGGIAAALAIYLPRGMGLGTLVITTYIDTRSAGVITSTPRRMEKASSS